MDLSVYDQEFVAGLFSLNNNGNNLCYLNSLIQALVSLPSFNQFLMMRKEDLTKNKTAMAFIELLEQNPQPEKDSKFSKIRNDTTLPLLRALVEFRRSMASKYNFQIGAQEDAHEGLMLLVDALGWMPPINSKPQTNEIDALFHVRYSSEIYCRECKHKRKSGPEDQPDYLEPPEIMVDLSEDNPNIQESLETKEQIQNYIKRNLQFPDEYRCENCKTQNKLDPVTKKVQSKVYQVYSLARLSEVIVIIFKKYKTKKVRFFPPELEFPSRGGTLHYRVVAQIEHMGGEKGGHYTAKCLRVKPPGWNEFRKQKAEKLISTETIRLEAAKNIQECERLNKQIAEYKSALDHDEQNKDNSEAVFIFNDRDVKYCPTGFTPTENTYMVFYHLFPDAAPLK